MGFRRPRQQPPERYTMTAPRIPRWIGWLLPRQARTFGARGARMKRLHPTGRSAGARPGRWLVATDRGLGPTLRRCRRTARRLRVAGEDASAAVRLRPRLSSEARRPTPGSSHVRPTPPASARRREQRAQRKRQQVARSRQARTTNAKPAAEQRDAASVRRPSAPSRPSTNARPNSAHTRLRPRPRRCARASRR